MKFSDKSKQMIEWLALITITIINKVLLPNSHLARLLEAELVEVSRRCYILDLSEREVTTAIVYSKGVNQNHMEPKNEEGRKYITLFSLRFRTNVDRSIACFFVRWAYLSTQ